MRCLFTDRAASGRARRFLGLVLILGAALSSCARPRAPEARRDEPAGVDANATTDAAPRPADDAAKPDDAAVQTRPTVYAWFPRDVNNWDTSAIDFTALTHICYRAVVLQPDGSVKPGWGATRARIAKLVAEAHGHGVKVTVLGWGTDSKGSSQYLGLHAEQLAKNLVAYVVAHDLDGVNIDDETWREKNSATGGSNRGLVTAFFRHLRRELDAARPGAHLSYASPPVVSPRDKHGASWIDFASIAPEVDAFTIMSYCMNPPTIGWTGSANPVAGGGEVTGHARDYETLIADYLAATGGARDKLLLGIDNGRGGVEWKVRSDQPLAGIYPLIAKPRKLSAEEARANAAEHGRRFHPEQKAPWYCYAEGDHFVQGWYEDGESLGAKMALAGAHDLAGICVWVLDGAGEPRETFELIHEHVK